MATIRANGKRAIISDVALVPVGTRTEFEGDVTVRYIFLPKGQTPQLNCLAVTTDDVIEIGVSGCETGQDHAGDVQVTLHNGRKIIVYSAVRKLDNIANTSLFRIQCAAYDA